MKKILRTKITNINTQDFETHVYFVSTREEKLAAS